MEKPHNEKPHIEKSRKKHKKKKRRSEMESSLPKLPMHVALLKFQTSQSLIANTLKGVVGGFNDEETCTKFRALKSQSPSQYLTVATALRNMVRKIFGAYMPTLPFKSYSAAAVTSTTGIVVTVVTLEASVLAGFGYYGSIFDEYRPTGPFRILFYPTFVSSVQLLVGVIDYIDATALSSAAAGMLYDTAKVFAAVYGGGRTKPTEWKGHLLGIPDLTWLDTSTTTTDFAYWKAYAFANTSGSNTYGYLWFDDVSIEFRQQAGA